MAPWCRLKHGWRTLFGTTRLERELDDELRGAEETLRDRYRDRGMSEQEARRTARIALGGVEPVKEAVRDARVGAQLESALGDMRYALRMLRKSPAFTIAALTTLALGIGANAAIFTFINALALRPLPVHDPASLFELSADRHGKYALLSFPMYRDLAAQQDVLAGIVATAGETPVRVTIPGPGGVTEVDNVGISFVSGNYFSLLGVAPAAGRLFGPGDDVGPDTAKARGSVVVISDGFWRRQFGRDPAVVGRTILIGLTQAQVIGVTPPGFGGEVIGNSSDGWVPLTPWSSVDNLENRAGTFTGFFARLKPGVSEEAARARLSVLFQQLATAEGIQPKPEELSIALTSAAAGIDFSLRRTYLQPLLIVMGMVALVLLMACANVANLLLARAASRAGEIGVRLALGCSRARLIRQLLTESAMLSAGGALAGLLVSRWVSQSIARLTLGTGSRVQLDLGADIRVFAFLAALALVTTFAFGLLPALRATRVDLAPALKGLRRAGGGPSRQRAGKLLVVTQVAASALLLAAAGLLVRSFQNMRAEDLGFSGSGVVLFSLGHSPADRSPDAMTAVEQAVRERVLAVPGVESASLSGIMLFSQSDIGAPFMLDGDRTPSTARYNSVSPGYFETVGMRVVAGRSFVEADDRVAAAPVTVVNESFATQFFGDAPHAIGRTMVFSPGPRGKRLAIVGVVADAKYNTLRQGARAMFYLPYAQMTRALRSLEVRTSLPAAAVTGPVREAISATTKDLMIRRVLSIGEQIEASLAAERLLLRLCVLFGGLALVLASVGLYGVISYAVLQRTPEIGLRLALGATPGGVMRGILRDTLLLVVAGIAVGLPAALASGRLLESFLYGLTPRDPLTLGAAALIPLGAGLLAAAIPALRASRVDPNRALR